MAKKKHPLIVFCGMDGSGKTTLAEKLVNYFERQGREIEFIHGHGYTVSENSFGLDEKRVKRLKYLFKLLIPLALLDNLYTYYFKYKPLLKNKTLICDRYFYDKLARVIYYGICPPSLAKIYLKLLPKPDFAFFLDADPQKAHARKRELSEEELVSFRKIYKFLAECLEAPVIDTGLSLNVCYKKILEYLD